MRALLLWPRFPVTFWSFDSVLELVGLKALVPPLGLVTVAAIFPEDWQFKLVDCNVREPTDAEWDWAEIVLLSGMNVQREDFAARIRESRRRGKPVAVGGPFATSMPDFARSCGADCLVLDEGEITIPALVRHLKRHGLPGPRTLDTPPLVFRADGDKPDMTRSPMPRFDLLELDAYDTMSIQYSRGCPFLCEFCDIINLYGRRPRTKEPRQILAELDELQRLGWRRGVFLVDDNFIGNKRTVKGLLTELIDWQRRNGYPTALQTEASMDLALDPELMDLMRECQFEAVFIGIETPDEESLVLTRKRQNTRHSMVDSVRSIQARGMRVMAGFIVGFDNEAPGAGERIVRFVEQTNIPTVFINMLQVLPNTALWEWLSREGRLLPDLGTVSQEQLINFIPTRPMPEIAAESMEAIDAVTDPRRYIDRCYRYFLGMAPPYRPKALPPAPDHRTLPEKLRALKGDLLMLRAFAVVCWRQGVLRKSRWRFWHHLAGMLRQNPGVFVHYVAVCAHNEHFLLHRERARRSVEAQLEIASTTVYRTAAGSSSAANAVSVPPERSRPKDIADA